METLNSNNEEYYLYVLNEWKDGNYSDSVELHNLIWSIEFDRLSADDDREDGFLNPEKEALWLESNFE